MSPVPYEVDIPYDRLNADCCADGDRDRCTCRGTCSGEPRRDGAASRVPCRQCRDLDRRACRIGFVARYGDSCLIGNLSGDAARSDQVRGCRSCLATIRPEHRAGRAARHRCARLLTETPREGDLARRAALIGSTPLLASRPAATAAPLTWRSDERRIVMKGQGRSARGRSMAGLYGWHTRPAAMHTTVGSACRALAADRGTFVDLAGASRWAGGVFLPNDS